jgi:hypothetical protein
MLRLVGLTKPSRLWVKDESAPSETLQTVSFCLDPAKGSAVPPRCACVGTDSSVLVFANSARRAAISLVQANRGAGTPTRVGRGVIAGAEAGRGFCKVFAGDLNPRARGYYP